MSEVEANFQNILNNIGFFGRDRYTCLHYPLYKYTAELLYDNETIPDKYITVENNILHQFPKIYKRLAKRGDDELVKKMLRLGRDSCMYRNSDFVMYGAAEAGNIKLLEWMFRNGYKGNGIVICYAARGNQTSTLKWLIDNGHLASQLAVSFAGGKGHMEIVKFLVESGCDVDCEYIADKGQFEIVKYLHSVRRNSSGFVCEGAINSGNLDMLKFGYANGSRACDEFFSCKDVHILSWLIDNQHVCPSIAMCQNTAQGGNLDCMKLLYHHEYPILTKKVFARAVLSRNIELITWLHDLGCPFDERAISAAVNGSCMRPKEYGSLPILKMLVEWDCPIGDTVCETAAEYGDLDMLKYLVSFGARINAEVINRAAYGGHLHVIIWARELGCEWNAKACAGTVNGRHMVVLKWLRGIDRDKCGLESNETEICPWDAEFQSETIRCGRQDILEFAKANGYVTPNKKKRAVAQV